MAQAQARLNGNGRPVPPLNFHVTLAFLGLQEAAVLPQVCALAEFKIQVAAASQPISLRQVSTSRPEILLKTIVLVILDCQASTYRIVNRAAYCRFYNAGIVRTNFESSVAFELLGGLARNEMHQAGGRVAPK